MTPNPQRRKRYRASSKPRPDLHELTGEDGVQQAIEQAFSLHRFFCWHIPARAYAGSKCEACGHQNRATGILPGLPDTLAIGPRQSNHPHLFLVESKRENGALRPEQKEVLDLLENVEVLESGVVRPSNLEDWLQVIARAGR